jgi:hypothetical protein
VARGHRRVIKAATIASVTEFGNIAINLCSTPEGIETVIAGIALDARGWRPKNARE